MAPAASKVGIVTRISSISFSEDSRMVRIGAASAPSSLVFGLAMQIERLNERAILVRHLDGGPPYAWAKALEAEPILGLIEAVAAKETLGLFFESTPDPVAVEAALSSLQLRPTEPALHRIPVSYALGEDFSEAAATLGITTAELAELHAGQTYSVDAIGFSPGFPYLSALDPRLSGLPRRPSPRPRVRPGSVGITGIQTCVYPTATPGGWNLIGVTPLRIADRDTGYFPLKAGDHVRFEPIDEAEFARLEGTRL